MSDSEENSEIKEDLPKAQVRRRRWNFPIIWIVGMSLDPRNIARPDSIIPPGANLDAYARVLQRPTLNPVSFLQLALNSLTLAALISALSVGLGVLAAYAFSRMKFRGREFMMLLILAVLMLPSLRRRWRWALLACLAWVCLGLSSGWTRPGPNELRCTFLAVGHGGCAVLETPDGKALLYRDGFRGVWRQELDREKPELAKGFEDKEIYQLAWSPDGKRLAYTTGARMQEIVRMDSPVRDELRQRDVLGKSFEYGPYGHSTVDIGGWAAAEVRRLYR